MDIFLKVTAGTLVTVILSLILKKQGTDFSLLLTICVCGMVIVAAVTFFNPVLDFANRLIKLGQLNNELLNVLLKVIGIGLISQIAGLICADAGNQSLSKVLQIMSTAVILCLSVPLLEEVITLIEAVLGEA